MSALHDTLRRLGQSVVIDGDTIVIEGEVIPPGDAAPPTRDSAFFDPDPLRARLHRALYSRVYCRSTGSGGHGDAAALVARLRAANRGRPRWSEGWTVAEVTPSFAVVASKSSRVQTFAPGLYVNCTTPAVPAEGDEIAVHRAHESLTLQPGFYYAIGRTVPDMVDLANAFRVYWNVGPEDVPELVGAITAGFDSWRIPFRFKCAAWPGGYDRVDSAVLYVASRFHRVVLALVSSIHELLGERLRDDVPLFTRPLGRGIAVAEDPRGSESFGANRCRPLARALAESPNDAYRRILDEYDRAHIDLDRPWLIDGRRDDPYGMDGWRLG
ncbi:MAG TPA: T3SS effector HopA1 family protein [Thermoanaerobaculia bacterium]|nr:T3SS effector HopA1 family protein [Thermoanaerobaculia bacterium]